MYYSKLKIFHHRAKLDSFERGDITAPIHVRIKPTNVCNHNCSYCSYQNPYGQLGKDMVKQDKIPHEKLIEIIDDCAEMGVQAVTFSGGGEPLMYKGIHEILHYTYASHMKIGLLTNGILLSGDNQQAALECCEWVRISMDGWDNKSYSEYRGCNEGDFDKLMTNIKEIAGKQAYCTVGVNIIIDERNAPHLYDMVKMIHVLGINSIKISPCIMSNDSTENNNKHLDIRGIVATELGRIEQAGIKIYNSYHLQLEGFQKDYHWCPYIQIVPIIGADCNVYTCHDKAYNKDTGIIGSIKDQSFKTLWFNGKGKFYKIDPAVHCNHHCVIDNGNKMLIEYLDIDHKEFA